MHGGHANVMMGRNEGTTAVSARTTAIAAALLVLAGVAAYFNSFRGTFVFDDLPAIVENTTIRDLSDALAPPRDSGVTVSGRPLVNLSLALNYAAGGASVWGYHAANLAIHLLAALTLFGLARRTFMRPMLRDRFGASATMLACVIALLWTLHPLQTEAVTYVVQRAEATMGLFFLLTLYCFIRGIDANAKTASWHALAVIACACGMACKEVMVTAPVDVLLYDRTFVAGNFREALSKRWRFYLGLAATWLVLWLVMRESGDRGGSAGFGMGVTWWQYALTECKAVVIYLRLAVWPAPLVLDYQMPVAKQMGDVLAPMTIVMACVAVTFVALRRWPAAGFCAAWVFLILAPTSTVVPLADTMFEHRMYLSLAGIVALAVVAIHTLAARAGLVVFAALAVALGWTTHERNNDYRSEETIWADTVAKRPDNARAHYTLGSIYAQSGRNDEAMAQYAEALRLDPHSAETHVNLGNLLARARRFSEAVAHYEEALRLAPNLADAHTNLANLLAQSGRMNAAMEHFATALRLRPESAEAHNNLGNALIGLGRPDEARRQYEEALRLRPEFAEAHANLGNILAQSGRAADAVPHYEEALQIAPQFADAHFNLGTAFAALGRVPEAIAQFEAVLRIKPDYPHARENLAVLRSAGGAAAPQPSTAK